MDRGRGVVMYDRLMHLEDFSRESTDRWCWTLCGRRLQRSVILTTEQPGTVSVCSVCIPGEWS